MPKASYTNRKKELHYLKSVPTKNGKERFYIVKNKSNFNADELLLNIPEGFEFYELPSDAKVVLRKKLITTITSTDIQVVDSVMQSNLTATDYIIDKDPNALIVYLGSLSFDDFPKIKDKLYLIQYYDEKLRFEKVNEHLYKAQRFCYMNSHYGWITMESSESLKYLAEKYCYHIDKESLLEFWIEGEADW